MFQTGSRTIFDVCRPHIGHSINMLDIQEEGVVKGIRVYCRTCSVSLLIQETDDYGIRGEITRRKSIRLNAMSYEEWERQFIQNSMDIDGVAPQYEGSEWDELYNDYLSTLIPTPVQQSTGWDVDEPEPLQPLQSEPAPAPSGTPWNLGETDGWET